jgi:hypothetical protein
LRRTLHEEWYDVQLFSVSVSVIYSSLL